MSVADRNQYLRWRSLGFGEDGRPIGRYKENVNDVEEDEVEHYKGRNNKVIRLAMSLVPF